MAEMNVTDQSSSVRNVGHNSLAHLFYNLRVYRNLSPKALSKKCGVSENFVLGVEDGSINPPLKYWLSCGDEFGANPNWVRVKFINERSVIARRRLEEKIIGGGP